MKLQSLVYTGKLLVGFYGISNSVGYLMPYDIIHILVNDQLDLFLTYLFNMFTHNLNDN